jgi:uroporphyrinogen decarboxylase
VILTIASLILDHPAPDFAGLVSILKGETKPERVPLFEIGIDPEILKGIHESIPGEAWALPSGVYEASPDNELYYQQIINLYYRLGYDFVPLWPIWINNPAGKTRRATDTAVVSRGVREWVDESGALIRSWEDYENYPWDRIYAAPETLEIAARKIHPGMKVTVSASLFEMVYEFLLGYEGLFFNLHDNPQLVESVFNRWGQIVYDYYKSCVELDVIGAILHADDMGFNTSTLISPSDLRRLLFPWLAKYAALAHEHGKPFWLHSCGNLYRNSPSVMDDLIDMVKIDGFHSFQDVILPVGEAKARFGDRVPLMGGVDMHKLATLPEDELRNYLHAILDRCMPGGRFAFGSGNTIANYIPLKNYAILLEEARRWKP